MKMSISSKDKEKESMLNQYEVKEPVPIDDVLAESKSDKEKDPVSSKFKVKKYFLPVYLIWAIVIPTGLILLNAYRLSQPGTVIFDYIIWDRVPSMYALFGLIYPLTIVTFEGFYHSFTSELGFDEGFWQALDILRSEGIDEELLYKAKKSVILVLIFTILWVGPIGHLLLAFFFHKKYISKKNDKTIGWSDYLFGFI